MHDIDESVIISDPRRAELAIDNINKICDKLKVSRDDVVRIGSTAVPDLAAKPIIDLMVATKKADIFRYTSELELLNYINHDESGVPGRTYLTLRYHDLEVSLHLIDKHSLLWSNNIKFRNALRGDKELQKEYEKVKRSAAAKFPTLLNYSVEKNDFIDCVLKTSTNNKY